MTAVPPPPAAPPRPAEALPQMSDDDFSAFARIVHAETGIVLTEAKRSLLVSRLARRLRRLGLRDFAAYRDVLERSGAEGERRALISAITTNVTSFFREPRHFQTLAARVPEFAARARRGERIRIWSAGCATGQEPYTIAVVLLEAWPEVQQFDVRILATDIDPQAVAQARRGVYDARLVGPDAPAALRRQVTPGADPGTVAIAAPPRSLIRFEELNLLGPWPFKGQFDVIFCRNVVIYFDAVTRRRLWERFAERLRPGGLLCIGHSERVDAGLEALLAPEGITQYRRTDRAAQSPAQPAAQSPAQTPAQPPSRPTAQLSARTSSQASAPHSEPTAAPPIRVPGGAATPLR